MIPLARALGFLLLFLFCALFVISLYMLLCAFVCFVLLLCYCACGFASYEGLVAKRQRFFFGSGCPVATVFFFSSTPAFPFI